MTGSRVIASHVFIGLVVFLALTAGQAPGQNDSTRAGGRKLQRGLPPGKSHEEFFEETYQKELQESGTRPIVRLAPTAPLTTFPNLNITNDVNPQNEPSVRISHKDPHRMVAAWRDFRTGVTPAVRRVGYSFSTDGGLTWGTTGLLPQYLHEAGYTRNSDPAVCVDTSGTFYIATVTSNDNEDRLKLSVYKSSATADFFDQAHFVPSDTADTFYDKEFIACDLSPASPYVNNLYVAWSGVKISRSTDNGVTWSHALPLSTGSAPDLAVGADGGVNVVSFGEYPGIPGFSNVILDRSTDGGVSFPAHAFIDSLQEARTTYVNSYGFASIATDMTAGAMSGAIYVVWADGRNADLDVFLSRSTDAGSSWSRPARVNDDPVGNGKDQFWPWVAVDDRGLVTIVYYDTRNTPGLDVSETYVAHSWDGGLTFTNRLVSSAQSPRNVPNGSVRFGDYIGIDSWGGHTVAVWTDERAGGVDMDIYTATLDTMPVVNFSGVSLTTRPFWNMLSLPVHMLNPRARAVFTGAVSPAFAYDTKYVVKDTLKIGRGYWVRYPSQQIERIFGDSVATDTLPLATGWNLIGSITRPVPFSEISTDPPGILSSPLFGFNGSYRYADTIEAGQAYWVKSAGEGKMMLLTSPPGIPPIARALEAGFSSLNALTLTDHKGFSRSLYFGEGVRASTLERSELPPYPPDGAFDIRFAGGRAMAAPDSGKVTNVSIELSGVEYPLSMRWTILHPSPASALIYDGMLHKLAGSDAAIIRAPIETLTLRMSPGGAPALPAAYALAQNYPNPFNPATTLNYFLPYASKVRLSVYDVLGQLTTTLVDRVEEPGYRSVEWDAGDRGSGIYFYRLEAVSSADPGRSFTQVRKMIYLK